MRANKCREMKPGEYSAACGEKFQAVGVGDGRRRTAWVGLSGEGSLALHFDSSAS